MEIETSIQCLGFIMDGNRRWAKKNGVETIKGHEIGFEKFKEVVEWSGKLNIKNVVFYAFSSENWNRDVGEVSGLMKLFLSAGQQLHEAIKNDIRLRVIGDRSKFSPEIQTLITQLETKTKDNKKGTVTIALSYGGRAEILAAANEAIKSGKELKTEEDFEKFLWTKSLPDPDIIIRTGDAIRLSNFLPWQSVYSEFYFTKTLWPDFSKEEFEQVLTDFKNRQRRHGK